MSTSQQLYGDRPSMIVSNDDQICFAMGNHWMTANHPVVTQFTIGMERQSIFHPVMDANSQLATMLISKPLYNVHIEMICHELIHAKAFKEPSVLDLLRKINAKIEERG